MIAIPLERGEKSGDQGERGERWCRNPKEKERQHRREPIPGQGESPGEKGGRNSTGVERVVFRGEEGSIPISVAVGGPRKGLLLIRGGGGRRSAAIARYEKEGETDRLHGSDAEKDRSSCAALQMCQKEESRTYVSGGADTLLAGEVRTTEEKVGGVFPREKEGREKKRSASSR